MKHKTFVVIFLLAGGLGTGCADESKAKQPQAAKTDSAKESSPAPAPNPSQPKPPRAPEFETRELQVGSRKVTAEIADTDEKRAYGLMFRDSLPENRGMLFVFEREQTLSFWMRNTRIPLSIAYIDASGKIIDIQEMVPAPDSEPYPTSYPSARPAKYALEMNKGWFKKYNVRVGDKVAL